MTLWLVAQKCVQQRQSEMGLPLFLMYKKIVDGSV